MKIRLKVLVLGFGLISANSGYSFAHTSSYDGSVTIERVAQLKRSDMQRYSNPSKFDMDEVSQKLSALKGLAAELESHSVQLNNVVKITSFQNGNALVYVK